MIKAKILRVWGKADSFDIEFEHKGGTRWICRVPPDTKDGQYATEIRAVNEFGETAYWTGILYMCGGVCHLEILSEPFTFWFSASRIDVTAVCQELLHISEKMRAIVFGEPDFEIHIKKGCCHV